MISMISMIWRSHRENTQFPYGRKHHAHHVIMLPRVP